MQPYFLLTTKEENNEGKIFDEYISQNNLRAACRQIKNHKESIEINQKRLVDIFQLIEIKTSEAEENNLNTRLDSGYYNEDELTYPPVSPARMEMTEMYNTLRLAGSLNVFGAASDVENLPAQGSKLVAPTTLESATGMSMVSLTPKPTNTLLYAGGALAVTEGILSVSTGIDLNFLVATTLLLAFLDKLLVNGAVFESFARVLKPEYSQKILRHEAGHFLCAYLLGCPVEGYVLSSWEALQDTRFGGRSTSVSAGTSFFDPELSEQMNGLKPLSRKSIDRYSIIVMGGIAAEALNYGRADGGAGDEMALVRFLSSLNPKAGKAVTWDSEMIRNQARWGAMQAVLLLKQYSVCYDALVKCLERRGSLGECVYAIENAARNNDLTLPKQPMGFIVDSGLFGEWKEYDNKSLEQANNPSISIKSNTLRQKPTTSMKPMGATSYTNSDQGSPDSILEDDISSSGEFLDKYREIMTQKLADIDERLNELDKKTP